LCNNKIEAKSGAKLTVKELVSQANSVAVGLIKRGIEARNSKCTQKPFQLKSHIMRKKFLFLYLSRKISHNLVNKHFDIYFNLFYS
jgi:hypothetical protein